MKMSNFSVALILLLTPALALAHPGHSDSGLLAGASHPLGGLDHLLAMLAVGLWAAQQQGAARWALPLSFIASLLGGGLLGFAGVQLAGLESFIASSV
ncbi:MAG: HupE/UreJ family protein, partial [Pseudomonadaceae bacterium]|nr:HupE/UreJ family protein [Pseudomonadaceae bacterium]